MIFISVDGTGGVNSRSAVGGLGAIGDVGDVGDVGAVGAAGTVSNHVAADAPYIHNRSG